MVLTRSYTLLMHARDSFRTVRIHHIVKHSGRSEQYARITQPGQARQCIPTRSPSSTGRQHIHLGEKQVSESAAINDRSNPVQTLLSKSFDERERIYEPTHWHYLNPCSAGTSSPYFCTPVTQGLTAHFLHFIAKVFQFLGAIHC